MIATAIDVHCMGGWCALRGRCAQHYSHSHVMSERLCAKGDPQPVHVLLPVVRDDELPAPLRAGALEVF